MITAIAKRSILVKQEETGGGKRKDVYSKKGEKMQLTEKEAIMYWGAFQFNEKDQKSLLAIAKKDGVKRKI
jgi:hypothetical protein